MEQQTAFPTINLPKTGKNIEALRKAKGLSVKDLQNYFGFEYPQAIYKWQHGECLPTVDNLLALSRLLKVRMEDLLVINDREAVFFKALNGAAEPVRIFPVGRKNGAVRAPFFSSLMRTRPAKFYDSPSCVRYMEAYLPFWAISSS